MKKNFAIAIDGTAGSGKSTLGRRLARKLKLRYVDSGAMYRAIGWKAIKEGADLSDTKLLAELAGKAAITQEETEHGQLILLDGLDVSDAIRSPQASSAASRVALVPEVRAAVNKLLRLMAQSGVVMEGRDIGTVVLPDADVKLFLNASLEVRALRRKNDHEQLGLKEKLQSVETAIKERDKLDESRKSAPMVAAADATVIDTSNRSLDDLEEIIMKIVNNAI